MTILGVLELHMIYICINMTPAAGTVAGKNRVSGGHPTNDNIDLYSVGVTCGVPVVDKSVGARK